MNERIKSRFKKRMWVCKESEDSSLNCLNKIPWITAHHEILIKPINVKATRIYVASI